MHPEETKELSHSPRKSLRYFQTMDVGTKRHPRWSCFSALTVSVIAILKSRSNALDCSQTVRTGWTAVTCGRVQSSVAHESRILVEPLVLARIVFSRNNSTLLDSTRSYSFSTRPLVCSTRPVYLLMRTAAVGPGCRRSQTAARPFNWS
jgi:hypothetical protein